MLRLAFGLTGLPAITEELGGESIGRQGQMLQEAALPGASPPIVGTTAGTLSAAQDFAKSSSRKSRQKRDMENAEATHNPGNTSIMELSVAKPASSRISGTS